MKRSRSYPAIELHDACKLIRIDLRPLADVQTGHDRNSIARMLSYASGSGGAAARKVAALTAFGALDRRGGQYGLSILGRQLQTLTVDSNEYTDAVKAAFRHPPLFRDLIEECTNHGRLPNDLEQLLETRHGITPKASRTAACVFTRSAQFAGFLTTDGNLVDPPVDRRATVNQPPTHPVGTELTDSQSLMTKNPIAVDRYGRSLRQGVIPITLPNNEEAIVAIGFPQEVNSRKIKFFRKRLKSYLEDLDALFPTDLNVEGSGSADEDRADVISIANRKRAT